AARDERGGVTHLRHQPRAEAVEHTGENEDVGCVDESTEAGGGGGFGKGLGHRSLRTLINALLKKVPSLAESRSTGHRAKTCVRAPCRQESQASEPNSMSTGVGVLTSVLNFSLPFDG